MQREKRRGLVLAGVWLLLASFWSHGQEGAGQHFQAIASKLDPGGDLFLVIQAGRWLERQLSQLEQGADAGHVPAATADERDLRAASGRLRQYLARQGIGGLQGIGISTVPRTSGNSTLKLFVLRDPVDANLPFWRGVFGWQPRRLLSLDFLPADTAAVWAGTPEPKTIWALLRSAMTDLGGEDRGLHWHQIEKQILDLTGKEADEILGSLRDELLVAVRFSGEGGEAYVKPAFLLVAGTGSTDLLDAMRGWVEAVGGRLQSVTVSGHNLSRFLHPEDPEDMRQRLAFAHVPGFFVIGSNSQMVEDALRAQRHRSGLTSRPSFQNAFRGQNMVNNGILFVSEDGARQVRMLREERIGKALPEDLQPATRLFLTVLGRGGMDLPVCALTISNWRQGVMVAGMTGMGGEALASWLVSPPATIWVRWLATAERWLSD